MVDEAPQEGTETPEEPVTETLRERRERIKAGGATSEDFRRISESLPILDRLTDLDLGIDRLVPAALKDIDVGNIVPTVPEPLNYVPPDVYIVRAVSATTDSVRALIELQQSIDERQAEERAEDRRLGKRTFRLVAASVIIGAASLVVAIIGLVF